MRVDRAGPGLLCSSHEGSHFSSWRDQSWAGGNKGECQGGASLRSRRKSFLNSKTKEAIGIVKKMEEPFAWPSGLLWY